jgi:alpha-L-fucosidase
MKSGEFNIRYEVTDYVDRKRPGQAIIEAFFTAKDGDLYSIIPGWPARKFEIRDVPAPAGMKVTMLGAPQPLQWSKSGNGIVVNLPEVSGDAAKAQYASVLKLQGLAK